jgi:hypothetical protein
MNVLRRIAMAIGGTVVVALVLMLAVPRTAHAVFSALVTVVNTPKNPVPVQEVKESPGNFISVAFVPDISSTYTEVSPDGTISSTPFSIPAGEQFVITDVNWITACENLFSITCSKSAGSAAILVLGSSGSFASGSYMSQAIYAPAANSNLLTAGRSDRLKSGLVVTQLPLPSILFGPSGNGENIVGVNLRGYLVP